MTDALDRRPGLPAADLHERIREAAFALLLTERRPIDPDEIAISTGTPRAGLPTVLDQLAGAGWIDRDEQGRVTGSAGLSLTTGPHRIAIDGDWVAPARGRKTQTARLRAIAFLLRARATRV